MVKSSSKRSRSRKRATVQNARLAERPRRTYRLVLSLTEEEHEAINKYCKCFRTGSKTKARIVRELLLSQMVLRYEEEQPMLFSEEEMCL